MNLFLISIKTAFGDIRQETVRAAYMKEALDMVELLSGETVVTVQRI